MPRSRRQHEKGLTLPEVLMASAILAVIVVAVTQTIVAGQTHSHNALHEERAMSLADALLEEIMLQPYTDVDGDTTFGPDTGETTRADFDGLDDFHGYTEAADAIADAADSLYPDVYQPFTRTVTVVAESPSVAAFGSAATGMTITVSVSDPGGRAWSVSRWVKAGTS